MLITILAAFASLAGFILGRGGRIAGWAVAALIVAAAAGGLAAGLGSELTSFAIAVRAGAAVLAFNAGLFAGLLVEVFRVRREVAAQAEVKRRLEEADMAAGALAATAAVMRWRDGDRDAATPEHEADQAVDRGSRSASGKSR